MNEQNIMENNEVLEVAEDIVKTNSGLGWKIIGGVLITAGTIYGGLKLIKKLKTKKEETQYGTLQSSCKDECYEEEKNEEDN